MPGPIVEARDERLFGLPRRTTGLLLFFLTAVDTFVTLQMTSSGLGREINPAVDWMLGLGTLDFLVVKTMLSALCVLWIVRLAPITEARLAALAGFAIYVPIVGMHLYSAHVFLPRYL